MDNDETSMDAIEPASQAQRPRASSESTAQKFVFNFPSNIEAVLLKIIQLAKELPQKEENLRIPPTLDPLIVEYG